MLLYGLAHGLLRGDIICASLAEISPKVGPSLQSKSAASGRFLFQVGDTTILTFIFQMKSLPSSCLKCAYVRHCVLASTPPPLFCWSSHRGRIFVAPHHVSTTHAVTHRTRRWRPNHVAIRRKRLPVLRVCPESERNSSECGWAGA